MPRLGDTVDGKVVKTAPRHWEYQGAAVEAVPEGFVGFVYLLTLPNGQRYIGKKSFRRMLKRPPLKGKVRCRREIVESDWRRYCSSSETIKAFVRAHGAAGIKREILWLCKSKAEMSYMETKEILARDAVLDDQYLNLWFSVAINRNQLAGVQPFECEDD